MIRKLTPFIFVLLFCLLPASVKAVQFAITVPKQTVIYSDMDLKSPIGYLKADTVIKVGEVSRRGDTILPSIISGKIVYVRIRDIRILDYNRAQKIIAHQKTLRKGFSPKELVTLGMQYFILGKDWHLLQDLEEIKRHTPYGEHLKLRYQYYKHISKGRLNWRLGVDYRQIQDLTLHYKAYGVTGGLSYYLIYGNTNFLNAVGELTYFPSNSLKIGEDVVSGLAYNLDFTIEYSLNFFNDFFIQISVGYYYQKNLKFDVTPRINPAYMSYYGYNFYFGIGYQLNFFKNK